MNIEKQEEKQFENGLGTHEKTGSGQEDEMVVTVELERMMRELRGQTEEEGKCD